MYCTGRGVAKSLDRVGKGTSGHCEAEDIEGIMEAWDAKGITRQRVGRNPSFQDGWKGRERQRTQQGADLES